MEYKKTLGTAFIITVLTGLALTTTAFAGGGNGAPSGAHFNLNLVGLKKGGSESTSANGQVIFVPLQGKCIIDLTEGTDFSVIPPNNCIEQTHVAFELPPPTTSTSATTVTGATTTQTITTFTLAY